MIVGKIAGAVLKLILPDVTEHLLKVFKMDKLLNYMELPNEADKAVEKLKVENEMVKGQMKDMMNEINQVKNVMEKLKKIRSL
tara:strand:+ start:120 stop:368 length:249 start_codon:yes stop_codon:yes gene_type:complete